MPFGLEECESRPRLRMTRRRVTCGALLFEAHPDPLLLVLRRSEFNVICPRYRYPSGVVSYFRAILPSWRSQVVSAAARSGSRPYARCGFVAIACSAAEPQAPEKAPGGKDLRWLMVSLDGIAMPEPLGPSIAAGDSRPERWNSTDIERLTLGRTCPWFAQTVKRRLNTGRACS